VVRHYLGVILSTARWPSGRRFTRAARRSSGFALPARALALGGQRQRPVKSARVNGGKVKPGKDGILRLPADFAGEQW